MDFDMKNFMQPTDRDIINQWIFGKIFDNLKDSLLVEMGLDKSDLDGYIGFCYIDDSMGISCRIHSLCKKEEGKKPDIIVNLQDAFKDIVLRYDCLEVIEILDEEQVKSLGLEEKPTWYKQFYESMELEPIREREDLDQFRAPGFFYDVEAILVPKNLENAGEKIWVRLREITEDENIFRGVLLNQPYGDFGVNEGDSVTVLLFKENSESTLVCGPDYIMEKQNPEIADKKITVDKSADQINPVEKCPKCGGIVDMDILYTEPGASGFWEYCTKCTWERVSEFGEGKRTIKEKW